MFWRQVKGRNRMDWQGIVIWVVSGVLVVALIIWLVSLAVKSGKKAPMPTTTPYDTIDAPPPDDDSAGTH